MKQLVISIESLAVWPCKLYMSCHPQDAQARSTSLLPHHSAKEGWCSTSDLLECLANVFNECWVVRNYGVRKHEVLPNHQSCLVAGLEEGIRGIHSTPTRTMFMLASMACATRLVHPSGSVCEIGGTTLALGYGRMTVHFELKTPNESFCSIQSNVRMPI